MGKTALFSPVVAVYVGCVFIKKSTCRTGLYAAGVSFEVVLSELLLPAVTVAACLHGSKKKIVSENPYFCVGKALMPKHLSGVFKLGQHMQHTP